MEPYAFHWVQAPEAGFTATTFNIDLEKIFSPILEQWEKTGLVRLPGDGWMELTIAGEFWNVNLAQALIDYFLLAKKEKGCPGTMVL
jgi:hypothetical protein